MELIPRLIRPLPNPLGSYFRPNRNDHKVLTDFLTEETPSGLEGVVFDAALDSLHGELRDEVAERRLESVLDTRALELATPGGLTSSTRKLPWATSEPHTPSSFSGDRAVDLANLFAARAKDRSSSAILAPTHFLANSSADEWFSVDRHFTHLLRARLDAHGLNNTPIYYPLAIRSDAFFDDAERERLRISLLTLPIDALWLRIHPFGSRSGGRAVRKFIRACSSFHSSGLPIVAEHAGTVGLALLAFGAVGGVESGITVGENFDMNRLLAEPKPAGKGRLPDARVYLPEIQSFIGRKQARKFFENRTARSYFGCKERCCRTGADDMIARPKPHFLRRRLAEVSRLSEVPESLRPSRYMEEILRPATDKMVKAVQIEPALETSRQRLDALRVSLGAVLEEGAPASFSAVPAGKRIQIKRGA